MGPFDYEAADDAEVIDGQVTARQETAQQFVSPEQQYPDAPDFNPPQISQDYGPDASQAYDPSYPGVDVTGIIDSGVQLATAPGTSSIWFFMRLGVFGYIALDDEAPGLARLAAFALAAKEVLTAAQGY